MRLVCNTAVVSFSVKWRKKMFYNKKEQEIFEELNTSLQGLTQEEAEKRIVEYGKNILPQKPKDKISCLIFSIEFTYSQAPVHTKI